MEPKEASCGLHTQEVHGSSPCAPTIEINSLPPASSQELSIQRAKLTHYRMFWVEIAPENAGKIASALQAFKFHVPTPDFFLIKNRLIRRAFPPCASSC